MGFENLQKQLNNQKKKFLKESALIENEKPIISSKEFEIKTVRIPKEVLTEIAELKHYNFSRFCNEALVYYLKRMGEVKEAYQKLNSK